MSTSAKNRLKCLLLLNDAISRVILEELVVSRLVQKFPTLFWCRKFTTFFTRSHLSFA